MTFCTLFDSSYLAQGLTMINSLLKVNPDYTIYIAAMDEECYKSLNKMWKTLTNELKELCND